MRISDWSSDVCSSYLVWAADAEVETHRLADLGLERLVRGEAADLAVEDVVARPLLDQRLVVFGQLARRADRLDGVDLTLHDVELAVDRRQALFRLDQNHAVHAVGDVLGHRRRGAVVDERSEEHTSELQSLMRISYAVFCLKKKTEKRHN